MGCTVGNCCGFSVPVMGMVACFLFLTPTFGVSSSISTVRYVDGIVVGRLFVIYDMIPYIVTWKRDLRCRTL